VGGLVALGAGRRLTATVATVTSTATALGGRLRQKGTNAAAAAVAALGRQSLDLALAYNEVFGLSQGPRGPLVGRVTRLY
jgi:hypothetical protein